MDLSSLTVAQLRDLQQQIPVELKRREVQEKANILNEVRAFAKARGFALEELVGKEVKIKAPAGKVKVKYRHPENALRSAGGSSSPHPEEDGAGKGENQRAGR